MASLVKKEEARKERIRVVAEAKERSKFKDDEMQQRKRGGRAFCAVFIRVCNYVYLVFSGYVSKYLNILYIRAIAEKGRKKRKRRRIL